MKNRKKRYRRFFPVLLCLLTMMAGAVAQAAQEPVTARVPVRQEFKMEYAPEVPEDTAGYVLTPEDGAPLPEGADEEAYRFTLSGNETKELAFTYSHADIYTYTLAQTGQEEKEGYTYDDQIYTIFVYVKNTSNGGLEVSQIMAQVPGGAKADEILFQNSYKGQALQSQEGTSAHADGQNGGKSTVQTGDDARMTGWILAALLAAVAAFEVVKWRVKAQADRKD